MVRTFACVLVFLSALPRLFASCGSSSCPIDLHALQTETRGFSLDLSFQYIDQDQPRIGSRDAAVGAIPSDHSEVRTINRLSALQLAYGFSQRLQLSVIAPYVARSHEHIDTASHELEQW